MKTSGNVRIEKGSRVGIVCCSNGQPQTARENLERLGDTLQSMGCFLFLVNISMPKNLFLEVPERNGRRA